MPWQPPEHASGLVSQSQMERIAGASVNGASRYIATIVLTTLKCEMRSSYCLGRT